jgi:amidohydrolase family protein
MRSPTGELPIRIYALVLYRLLEHFAALNIRTGFGNDMLRIGPVKMVADGACAGRTMRMSKPYVGRPEDYGILTMTQEQLNAQVTAAHRAGFQIGIHANGDVPIEMVLNAYEKALSAQAAQDPRWRIEHCTLVTPTERSPHFACSWRGILNPVPSGVHCRPLGPLPASRPRRVRGCRHQRHTAKVRSLTNGMVFPSATS